MKSACAIVTALMLLAGAWLAGCAKHRPYDQLWVPPRPYQAERDTARPSGLEIERLPAKHPPTAPKPEGPITLHDAVGLALGHNPGLRAAGLAVTAAEADAMQLGRPKNPSVGFAIENFGGPDAEPVFERQTLKLSQVIELGGKRDKRRALGEATQRLRGWDYEQARIDVAAETASRFVDVVVLQESVALYRQHTAFAEESLAIAEDLVANGVAPTTQRDRAASALALQRIAQDQAEQELAAAREALSSVWGASESVFTAAEGDLTTRAEVPGLSALKATLGESPTVARWDDEIAQKQRALELARANGLADPTAGVGIRHFPDADDYAGVVSLTWPLNVLDDNRHGVLAARLRVARARAQRDQALADAGQMLARLYSQHASAAFALKTLDGQALPAARDVRDAAERANRAGQAGRAAVLQAEQELLMLQHKRLDALLAYHTKAIEIERLTGQSLAEPVPTTTPAARQR